MRQHLLGGWTVRHFKLCLGLQRKGEAQSFPQTYTPPYRFLTRKTKWVRRMVNAGVVLIFKEDSSCLPDLTNLPLLTPTTPQAPSYSTPAASLPQVHYSYLQSVWNLQGTVETR